MNSKEANERIEYLQQELARVKIGTEWRKECIDYRNLKIAELEEDKVYLNTMIDKLEKAVAWQKECIDSDREKIGELEEHLKCHKETIAELQRNLAIEMKVVAKWQKCNDNLQGVVKKLETRLVESEKEKDRHFQQAVYFEHENKIYQKEMVKAQARLAKLPKSKEEVRNLICEQFGISDMPFMHEAECEVKKTEQWNMFEYCTCEEWILFRDELATALWEKIKP